MKLGRDSIFFFFFFEKYEKPHVPIHVDHVAVSSVTREILATELRSERMTSVRVITGHRLFMSLRIKKLSRSLD